MKPLLLFAGQEYDAFGGWRDFVDAFDSAEDVRALTNTWVLNVYHPAAPATWERDRLDGTVLFCSTNSSPATLGIGSSWPGGGVIIGQHGRGWWLVERPATTETRYEHEWAHLVHDGQIVAEWHAGTWELL